MISDVTAMGSNTVLHGSVSVVIPARNAAACIPIVLRSLIPDAGLIKEILLVDDGSVDLTSEIALEYALQQGLPLRIISVSLGAAGAARNVGLAHAKGRFLFFVDADDEIFPKSLARLARLLVEHPEAGLAIGACVRQTAQREDKTKIPSGYTEDYEQNAIRYFRNEMWSIAMGSALFVRSQAAGIRFPETIGLDEDTCFWTALLTRVHVVVSAKPVLLYKLDEDRMARRFTSRPRRTLLRLAQAFRTLAHYGVPREVLKWRIAWVAFRIARQLIMSRRYLEADRILRLVCSHPDFCSSMKIYRYRFRIQVGKIIQRIGWMPPICESHSAADLDSSTSSHMVDPC